MTNEEKITFLKHTIEVNDDDTDDVLSVYLSIAGSKIIERAYPFDDSEEKEVPPKYHVLQCKIAAYLLDKRGAEGQTAHSENGISRTYENADVPNTYLQDIVPHCGIIK